MKSRLFGLSLSIPHSAVPTVGYPQVFPGLTKKELEERSREYGTRHYLSRMDEDEDDLDAEKEAKEKKIELTLEVALTFFWVAGFSA
mgnify:CR=1 FL=1